MKKLVKNVFVLAVTFITLSTSAFAGIKIVPTAPYLAEATKYLTRARASKGDNRQYIQWLREDIKKADAKLKDIGTSEKELDQLLKKGYIAEAKEYLAKARQSKDDNKQYIQWLREDLEKAGTKLAIIGTSEKELDQLLKKGYIAEAKEYLAKARQRKDDNALYIQWICEDIEKAESKLETIGTSEEELYQLLYDGFIAEANKWWSHFIESADGKMEFRFFLDALSKAAVVESIIEENEKVEYKLDI